MIDKAGGRSGLAGEVMKGLVNRIKELGLILGATGVSLMGFK